MIDDLTSTVESARDHAILGFYPESISMFEDAISQINEFLQSGNNLDRNWNKIKSDLNEEYLIVRKIHASLQRLRPLGSFPTPQQQVTPLSRQEPNNAFQIEISNNQFRGPAEMGRFKGLPFSHHQSIDPIETIDDFKSQDSFQNNYSPIWEEQKKEPKKIKRNLKPFTQPPQKIPKPKKILQTPKPPDALLLPTKQRITFLESRQGPDKELIEIIERNIIETSPGVLLDSIAELDDAKMILHETITLPSLMPEFFSGIRRPWKGILLYGPPGTGKTSLAKAVATMGGTTFFNVSASTIASRWRGESEKIIRLIFEMARFYAPSTIFFDEIDCIVSERSDSEHEGSRRVKTELLVQIDGMTSDDNPMKRIIIMAATNRPWDIDQAMIRRLEKRVYIPLPSKIGRKKIFEMSLSNVELSHDIDWNYLIKKSPGYSGADINCVCRDAAMNGLRREVAKLTSQGLPLDMIDKSKVSLPLSMDDLKQALNNIPRSVDKNYCKSYEKWMNNYGAV